MGVERQLLVRQSGTTRQSVWRRFELVREEYWRGVGGTLELQRGRHGVEETLGSNRSIFHDSYRDEKCGDSLRQWLGSCTVVCRYVLTCT